MLCHSRIIKETAEDGEKRNRTGNIKNTSESAHCQYTLNSITVTPRSHTRIFLTSPYGWPTRSQSQASVNNSLVSVNNSSQLADTLKDP